MRTNSKTDWTGHISLSGAYRLVELEKQVAAVPHALAILKGFVVAWSAALVFAVIFDLLGIGSGVLAAVLYFSLVTMSVAGVFLLKRQSRAATQSFLPVFLKNRRILRESQLSTM